MPPSPLLHQFGDLPVGTLCNETTVSNCGAEFCDCTYTLNVALGSLVELVLIDEGLYPLSVPELETHFEKMVSFFKQDSLLMPLIRFTSTAQLFG